MIGFLLIAPKNGRRSETYGVKQAKVCNMKFTIICIVTAASCSVCAYGDLEIYPGLKLNLDSDESKNPYDVPNFYNEYKRYPWQNIPMDDYGDVERTPQNFDLPPERIQKFKEIIDWSKSQLSGHSDHKDRYVIPRSSYGFEDAYKNFKDSGKHFGRFTVPNSQILDDIRMYPQDDDFIFKGDEEEIEDGLPNVYDRSGSTEEKDIVFQDNRYPEKAKPMVHGHGMHKSHKEEQLTEKEKFPEGHLSHVKVVEDPTEFAYSPPDPRFYKKPEVTLSEDSRAKPEKQHDIIESKTVGENVNIKLRSDDKSFNKAGVELSKIIDDDVATTMSRGSVNVVPLKPNNTDEVNTAGVYFMAIVSGISAAATVGFIAVGIAYYNLQKHVKNASDVEYPAYGVTGPNKDVSPSGDRRLAQSAQMYHYQHQKQQILAMERAPPGERQGSVSEAESDEENEEGDYTVYECPGLAPTGEMEVKNPLFQDDPTPAQTPAIKANEENKQTDQKP